MELVKENIQHRADTQDFLALLAGLPDHPQRDCRELFDKNKQIWITRAPGRLDVMGGIADYSGSLVLEWPIAEAAFVALQRDSSRRVRIITLADDNAREPVFDLSLDNLEHGGAPIQYDEALALFNNDPSRHWAAYLAGAFLVLMRERGARFSEGARILLGANVPEGKGVSSSAAIEVATMSAIAAGFGIDLAARDLAVLCQKVENEIAGAPCGVMDQMTSACGHERELLALRCQPAEIEEFISPPGDLCVWGIESGERHSVRGEDYGSVRTGAFMGYRMIANAAGLAANVEEDGVAHIADEKWHGYLANVSACEFETFYSSGIPDRMAGAEFLERYGGTTDKVTRVESKRIYPVLKPTAHAVYENSRVRSFAKLLRDPASCKRNQQLGELMYESHASYSACGLGSLGTDLLVNLVGDLGARNGLYGAKITGGGSGGTVAVLGSKNAEAAVRHIAASYEQEMGYRPYIFAGSSPGSASWGHLNFELQ